MLLLLLNYDIQRSRRLPGIELVVLGLSDHSKSNSEQNNNIIIV